MDTDGKSKIIFLGTGTSSGVPSLGCNCEVCRSADPRDRRMRCSSLLEISGKRILIDCGPDFYHQMLHRTFLGFDAVLLTHEHYDHVGGLDDLRPYSAISPQKIYCNAITAKHVRERLPYCFETVAKKGVPHLEINVVKPHETFFVGDVPVTPLRVYHGALEILGYRIGPLVYITDMKSMPDEEKAYLDGAKILVVNALRPSPHPTHQSVGEAVAFAKQAGIVPVYFIHMSHSVGLHVVAESRLPEGYHFAYDGLEVEF
jgi:phosphoribosyl 1,2-cyclic phosphate phosphodiesterase